MGHPKYLFKKGENFYFRRRIPGLSIILSPVFLSLGTKSEFFAHTCLSKLTTEFDDMLEAFVFAVDELPEDLIARYMTVRLQHAVTNLRRPHRMEHCTGRGTATNPTAIEAKKIVLEILLKDGIRKSFPLHLVQQDWNLHQLGAVMDAYRIETDLAASPALRNQLAAEFTSATGVVPASLEHHAQILEIYFHAKIASLEPSDDQRLQRLRAFRDMSARLIEQTAPATDAGTCGKTVDGTKLGANVKENAASQSNSQKPTTDRPKQTLVLTPGVEIITEPLTMALLNAQFAAADACEEALHRSHSDDPFGVDIAGACERSIKVALEAGHIDQKTAAGRRAKMKLFCLLTGVQTVTGIEQYHLHVFEERLSNTPLNFNRSHKDAELTLAAINIRADGLADEELGRSASTFNSHIYTIGAVLRHARAFDHSAVHPEIDTRLVRRREKTRGRKKRNAFKPAEIKKLFQHHVWHGCKSPARRQEPGQLINKDGLYFVPLIVAYTGSRMEEIAGLTTDAILPADGGFGFDICPHDLRRIKNPQSERLVPVHEHLIELGLLEHQAQMKKAGHRYLFPELAPKSAKKKFHSALRHNWRKLRDIQLDGNPRDLDAHSLRHAFNQALKLETSVSREVRLDILGHAGVDINEEVYGDEDGMLETMYIGRPFRNDTERLEKLFKLYAAKVKTLEAKKPAKKGTK